MQFLRSCTSWTGKESGAGGEDVARINKRTKRQLCRWVSRYITLRPPQLDGAAVLGLHTCYNINSALASLLLVAAVPWCFKKRRCMSWSFRSCNTSSSLFARNGGVTFILFKVRLNRALALRVHSSACISSGDQARVPNGLLHVLQFNVQDRLCCK